MKKTTAHKVEDFANKFGLKGKRISLILRSEDEALEDRPNALYLVRGKNGWTRCTQGPHYFMISRLGGRHYIHKYDRKGEILNGNWEGGGSYHRVFYREYTDDEILEILNKVEKVTERFAYENSDSSYYLF